ncbi:MAG: lytic transglycosylase domain-containing protein [Kofleriaceae bacterium]|nr:lytic transglycosylase domain-containing protein [Kofleriaceae bacterium]
MRLSLLLTLLLLCIGGEVRADVWSYTDQEKIIHFTNIRPTGASAGKWKRISRGGGVMGKVASRRGDCERCDRVPSRDRSPERFSRYDAFIFEAASLYQLPVALIRAVIKVESDYDPRVVSAFGARGLMQLMPSVISDMGVQNVHDPRENILGGTRLLRILANRYNGDLVLTIAAYHAGVGSLRKYGNTVPPYEHTRKYLGMVMERYRQYAARAE